ncbi:hypothetical protein [Herbiconiux sp. UC225_62]|uniref:hypothetical protein n=1 Tax=Herbiconiux sp. UC225_62 TaxID=3350168 RepID=UPI0036D41FAE
MAVFLSVLICAGSCLAGCVGAERRLPDKIIDRILSGYLDEEATAQCAQFVPDSPTSHLDASWFGTLSQAVELAEGFDSRNTQPRVALSNVDGDSQVAFCAFSGSQWNRMTPNQAQVLGFYAANVPLTQDPTLPTTVDGIIGYV